MPMPWRVPMKIWSLAAGDPHREQLVALLEVDRDDAARAQVRVGRERRLLDEAVPASRRPGSGPRGSPCVAAIATMRSFGPEVQEVHDRLAAGRRAELRQVVDLDPVHAARRREDQDVGVRRGDEQVLDEVLFLRRRADAALAAAALRAVERQGRALDVAAAGHGDDHVLLDDQVLDVDVGGLGHDLRAPLVAELLPDLLELLDDDLEDELLGAEDLAQLRDQRQDLLELGDDLLALEARSAAAGACRGSPGPGRRRGAGPRCPCPRRRRPSSAHADELLEARPASSRPRPSGAPWPPCGSLERADDLDDLVEVGERQREAAQQVRPLLGLLQVELRAPDDDRLAVVDEVPQQVVRAAGRAAGSRRSRGR